MPVNLKGRSFLTLKDFTPDEIRYMLNLAADLKAKKRAGIRGNLLAGKNIVLLFEKTSTRTRCAFEVAAYDEGANVTFLDSKSSQMGKKETMSTPPRSSAASTTASSTAATTRRSSRVSPPTRACPCGTA